MKDKNQKNNFQYLGEHEWNMKDLLKILKTKNKVKFIDLTDENDIIKINKIEAFNVIEEGHQKDMTIKVLSNSLSELTNIVKDLAIKVDNLTTRVDDLTTRVDNLTTRVDDLTTYVKEGFNQVNRRLDNLEKDVSVLKQDVNAIKQCPTIKKELNF